MANDLDNTLIDDGNKITENRGMNKISVDIPCCDDGETLNFTLITPKAKVALDVFNLVTSHLGVRVNLTVKKGDGGG